MIWLNNHTSSKGFAMNKDNLIVLSLFDGMSCGRITFDKIGIKPKAYYASELDKFAIKEAEANWPDTIQLGDVTKWREWEIDWSSIDLLIGGSPCQGFSFAGKQLAFDDLRSALFFVYVDILNHIKSVNPNVKFMLENVKMKKEHLNVITEYLGVEPVFINSALVSAQSRQRYYWANWEISQPQDRGILLKDILERKVGEDSKLSKIANSAAIVGRKINPETGKREDYNKKLPTLQTLEVQEHGKARCLSTVSKDCLVSSLTPGRYMVSDNNRVKAITENEHGYRPRRGDERKTGISELGRIYKENAKVHTLTTSHQPKLALNNEIENLQYRKLTIIECCRLQGVPDNYFKKSSNSQAYKMLGNGWQCDTIEHIFNCLFKESKNKKQKKYKLIYADPPWQFNNRKTGGNLKSGACQKYTVTSTEDLKRMDIESIADDDCILVMWWVGAMPQDAIDLVKAWGFTLKNMNGFVWGKQTVKLNWFFGMGFYTRAGTESAIIAIKGKPKVASRSVRAFLAAPVGRHSAKPDEFRDRCVELVGDVPRLEMFARKASKGWDVFGNEAPNSIDIKFLTGRSCSKEK